MPSDMVANQFFEISPETTTSCWATAAAMGPEPAKALIDAINRNDTSAANRLGERIAWANQPIQPILADQEGFASYNIQVEKTHIEIGKASCRERAWPYWEITVDAGSLKKKTQNQQPT